MRLTGMRQKQSARGFTIVELLIVIVVIGILASITVVAYGGIQARAQDSQRISEMNKLKKQLAIYYQLNGQYPTCEGNTICTSTGDWWPISSLPVTPTVQNDPKNYSGQWGYYYAIGFKQTGPNSFVQTGKNTDYLIGTRLANAKVATYPGWNNNFLNYLDGESSD